MEQSKNKTKQNKTHKGERLCSQQVVTTLENACGTAMLQCLFFTRGYSLLTPCDICSSPQKVFYSYYSLIRINIMILRTLNPFPGKHLTPFYFFTNNCSHDNIIWNLLKGVLVWPSLREFWWHFIHSKRCFSVVLKMSVGWDNGHAHSSLSPNNIIVNKHILWLFISLSLS